MNPGKRRLKAVKSAGQFAPVAGILIDIDQHIPLCPRCRVWVQLEACCVRRVAFIQSIVLPMQALWVLQTMLTALSIWKPKAALIGGVLYFVLISIVWLKYEGVMSVLPYLYDRSLDIIFLLALTGVFMARARFQRDGSLG
jgi:hypothetical protein